MKYPAGFCDRPTGQRHRLVWADVIDGELVVTARQVGQYTDGWVTTETPYRSGDVEGLGGLWVTVGCSCPRTYKVDVVPMFHGRKPRLVPEPPHYGHGISPDKRRGP